MIMHMTPAYVGIILHKNHEYFLVKRHNTDWAEGQWNFPGGLVEKGETILAAAAREAAEELNVVIKEDDLQLVHVLQVQASATNTRDIFGFYCLATRWEGTPTNNEPHRHSDARWFSVSQLPAQTTEHARQALHGLMSGFLYSVN